MNEMERLVRVANIAKGLDDPARQAEMARHHKAIIAALNNSHTNGEQDALSVFEAIAHTLAQLLANQPEHVQAGTLEFIVTRARILAPEYAAAGKGAESRFGDLH